MGDKSHVIPYRRQRDCSEMRTELKRAARATATRTRSGLAKCEMVRGCEEGIGRRRNWAKKELGSDLGKRVKVLENQLIPWLCTGLSGAFRPRNWPFQGEGRCLFQTRYLFVQDTGEQRENAAGRCNRAMRSLRVGGRISLKASFDPQNGRPKRKIAAGFAAKNPLLKHLPWSDPGACIPKSQTGIGKDNVYDFDVVPPNGAVIVCSHIDERPVVLKNVDPNAPLPTVAAPVPSRGLLVWWNGHSWQRREYPGIECLWTIHFVDANEAWASADQNGILHSTDGARTWSLVSDYYRHAPP